MFGIGEINMAMYNNFPVGYNPYYPQAGAQMSSPQQSTGIIWVQGEAGAKSYLVAPNTTVQLWDSENQVIYLKSADASGMPSMKIIDYTIRGSEMPVNGLSFDSGKFISRDELKPIEARLDSIQKELDTLKGA